MLETTTDEIEQFVVETLENRFDVPGEKLSPSADLKSLGIDSLGGVELSLALKKKYGVQFVAGEINVTFKVTDVAGLVREKLDEARDIAS